MRKYKELLIAIVVVSIGFTLMGLPVQAQNGSVSYRGVSFPLGNMSFADKVVRFEPGGETGEKDGSATIGPPDGGSSTGPSIIGAKGDVSLGKGGSVTLKFTDNYLIDVEGLDLYVFEYGRDVEPFKVEISKNGSSWIDLGTVRGQPTGLDIHGKVAPGDRFSYVRITDAIPYAPRDPKKIGTQLFWGADIDAVGAIGAEERHESDEDGEPDVKEPSKQSVCASAKPSITGGSMFKRAKFTIGGTEPQEIRITSRAENFSIVKEYGGIAFQVIKGKSWGSLTLKPGTYILSCNGGGAMGLMSASVCIEYPESDEDPTLEDETVPPKKDEKEKLPEDINKLPLPLGPIDKIIIRPQDNLAATKLYMNLGKEKHLVAWGEDAVGNKKSVIVKDWEVRGGDAGNINKDGVFKAGPDEGVVKVLATVKNQEGNYITGVFYIMVSELPPITFTGCVKLYDKNKRTSSPDGVQIELYINSYNTLEDFKNNLDSYEEWEEAQTDVKGRFRFEVEPDVDNRPPFVRWQFTLKNPSKATPGYIWQPRVLITQVNRILSNWAEYSKPIELGNSKPISVAPEGFKCFELFEEMLPVHYSSIAGKVTHHGKPVENAKVELFKAGKAFKEGEPELKVESDSNGSFSLDVENLPKGRYRLTAEYKPKLNTKKVPGPGNYITLSNWLIMRKDISVDLPLPTKKKTIIDIKLISWKEKIGYTGP